LTVFNIAASGLYDLRLVFYERDAGAELELFAASGNFSSFSTPDFRLVGDILTDGLPGQDSTLWVADSFDDSSWQLGTGGVGFARDGGYASLIQTDVGAQMYQVNGSCFIRIPFTVANASYASLMLQVRYDDGFVAYLNGAEVARRNCTGDPQWNSVASSVHPNDAAQMPESVDISDAIGLLRPGINVLALHGLNAPADGSDFLASVELVGSELSQGSASSAAITYAGPIPLKQTSHIKARAFNGKWSALNEALFSVGPVAQSLRISELMYHPLDTGNPSDPNAEFIELTNIANQNINLNLVEFTKGVHYTFPSFDLSSGGYCLVVKDLAAFQAKYGSKLPVVGQYVGSLDNAGERVEVVDAVGQIIQSFEYHDDWYKSTDGRGYSLTVVNPKATDANSLNDKNAWRPSTAVGGSPGRGD
jgi:hypothetical protein